MRIEWLLILANIACLALIAGTALEGSYSFSSHGASALFSMNSLLCSLAYFDESRSSKVRTLFVLSSVAFATVAGYLLSMVITIPGIILPFSISSLVVCSILAFFTVVHWVPTRKA